jgi:hypothetical protein
MRTWHVVMDGDMVVAAFCGSDSLDAARRCADNGKHRVVLEMRW